MWLSVKRNGLYTGSWVWSLVLRKRNLHTWVPLRGCEPIMVTLDLPVFCCSLSPWCFGNFASGSLGRECQCQWNQIEPTYLNRYQIHLQMLYIFQPTVQGVSVQCYHFLYPLSHPSMFKDKKKISKQVSPCNSVLTLCIQCCLSVTLFSHVPGLTPGDIWPNGQIISCCPVLFCI